MNIAPYTAHILIWMKVTILNPNSVQKHAPLGTGHKVDIPRVFFPSELLNPVVERDGLHIRKLGPF